MALTDTAIRKAKQSDREWKLAGTLSAGHAGRVQTVADEILRTSHTKSMSYAAIRRFLSHDSITVFIAGRRTSRQRRRQTYALDSRGLKTPVTMIVLAHEAYDADRIRALIEDQGAAPNIPTKSNRK